VRGFPIEVSAEAAAAHAAAFVVDLHNDALTKLTHLPYDFSRAHAAATFYNPLRLDLDVPRIRAGGIDALGCLMFAGFKVDRGRRFWRQLDRARRLVVDHPADLALARTVDEMRAARASGRIALFLGVEGSYALDDIPDVDAGVARLVEAGVRFLGPLWERDSACGTSCRTDPARDTGLTDRGRAVVRACNAGGILLDVSHASRKTFWDLMETSSTPPFSSHSGASGVHPHVRNLDDEQIRAVASRGGIVGVIFVTPYLGGPFASLERLADHVDHVARVGGEDCVALGSDFDGFMILPRGLRDAADLPRLTELLWRRGWREPQLGKFLGGNVLRYLGTTEAGSRRTAGP
jgi:membrane dipeptidase